MYAGSLLEPKAVTQWSHGMHIRPVCSRHFPESGCQSGSTFRKLLAEPRRYRMDTRRNAAFPYMTNRPA